MTILSGCGKVGVEFMNPAELAIFFSTFNFDLSYFCSFLTYKSVKYLNWKIWFISVWRLKAKVMAWLLTWFIFTQSTLISYHTEAFVKTEVGCTVLIKLLFCDLASEKGISIYSLGPSTYLKLFVYYYVKVRKSAQIPCEKFTQSK